MSRVVTNEEKTYVNLHRTVPLKLLFRLNWNENLNSMLVEDLDSNYRSRLKPAGYSNCSCHQLIHVGDLGKSEEYTAIIFMRRYHNVFCIETVSLVGLEIRSHMAS